MKLGNKLLLLPAATLLTACVATEPKDTSSNDYNFTADSKDATVKTKEYNDGFLGDHNLKLSNDRDFDYAQYSFNDFDQPSSVIVCRKKTGDGTEENECDPVWNADRYQDVTEAHESAPSEVNPSLWRNAQLNNIVGMFRVKGVYKKGDASVAKDEIFQVRGYDLSNITFVRGTDGWVVFDPLISTETAKAAYELLNKNMPATFKDKPVTAVIYSHSHTDHYGGTNGLPLANDVEIYAPEEFTEHAVSENVIAGNAMSRRAVLMYGSLIPVTTDGKGTVNAGLGLTTSTGVPGLNINNITYIEDGKAICANEGETWGATCTPYVIDGVKMHFQLTPGTEAPAEMNTWLPDTKALWMAENTTNTMHNILTLRGAKVRDALIWAKFLNETISLWGDEADVKFQSHHWPVWNSNKRPRAVRKYLDKQQAVYKYMHDQTVRLMNLGYNGEEISEMITLPKELDRNWATRGYYGTLRHNTRAIYQFYMGWYNGNPSDLNNLPDLNASIRFVDYMGGADVVINKAIEAYKRGEYRWVAEIMKQVVFAYSASKPEFMTADVNASEYQYLYSKIAKETVHTKAKYLLADAYEQMAYQAESGPWRSVYLQAANELRIKFCAEGESPDTNGCTEMPAPLQTASPETVAAMSADMIFDFWSVRLEATKSPSPSSAVHDFAMTVTQNCDATAGQNNDPQHFSISTQYDVLNAVQQSTQARIKNVEISICDLRDVAMQSIPYKAKAIIKNSATGAGVDEFKNLMDYIQAPDFWFNIVQPNNPQGSGFVK